MTLELEQPVNGANIEPMMSAHDVEQLREDVAYIKGMMQNLEPLLETLPALSREVIPIVQGLRESPVLKMLGVRLNDG